MTIPEDDRFESNNSFGEAAGQSPQNSSFVVRLKSSLRKFARQISPGTTVKSLAGS